MVTDTISDVLTRIRNAVMVKHRIVKVSNTKMSKEIISILKEEGFIEDFKILSKDNHSYILISLKYKKNSLESVITNLERVSKPGLRIYVKSKSLPKVLHGLGIAILSTSKGVITNAQAEKFKVGGEVLCYIW